MPSSGWPALDPISPDQWGGVLQISNRLSPEAPATGRGKLVGCLPRRADLLSDRVRGAVLSSPGLGILVKSAKVRRF